MMVILTMGPALNPRLDGVVVETIVVFLTIWGESMITQQTTTTNLRSDSGTLWMELVIPLFLDTRLV